ncbi:MAG TPA: anhydro-N-acetylmuramic acid kinase, partial [Ohtaekwangia sp.]|nr:anhydro-N-acetylmuramic acid kinase [Ohtaekwangia sp.]
LNYLMQKTEKEYDRDGVRAAAGKVNESLLRDIQKVYAKFRVKRPSLGREGFEKSIMPLLDQKKISLDDKLCTSVESTAIEIVHAIRAGKTGTVLCTGGGVFNSFLMSRILEHAGDGMSLIIPEKDVVKFKEALVFAFLGVLRLEKKMNCLRSVTGAKTDSSSGVMIGF